jgi:hypothetical protein
MPTSGSGPLRLLAILAVWGVCFLRSGVQATITIDETGEVFSSKEDAHYGPVLWKGYTYPGRLQRIDANTALCPPPQDGNGNQTDKHRLVIPSDGWPVALLAREGSCSVAEKLQYIQDSVTPSTLVKYLIVDDTRGRHVMIEEIDGVDASDSSGSRISSPSVQAEFTKLEELAEHDDNNQDDVDKKRDESIPIHILHVSFRTEYKLLDYLLHQSETTQADGGPRLTLDRRIHANHLSDNMALAIAALTMLGACLCSLALLVHGNRAGWWEPPPPPPAPARSNRRRLRREQVQAWLPVYRYTDDELELIPHTKPNDSTTPTDEESEHAPPPVPPNAVDLDCCAICLDDYEEGDRLRCVPACQHVFHSKCIGKWLVERSATCPLCKHDLYDSDDELDEDEEEENAVPPQAANANAGIQQITVEPPALVDTRMGGYRLLGWRRLWRSVSSDDEEDEEDLILSLAEDPQTEVENGSEEEPVGVTTEMEEPRLPSRSHRRRWWQRWSVRASPAAALTEPLLNLAEDEEAATDDEETGVAPLEMGPESVLDPPGAHAGQVPISSSE